MTRSIHTVLSVVWILTLCMLPGVDLHAAPAGDAGATVAGPPPGLTIDVSPRRVQTTSDLGTGTCYTDYLSGMPVFFSVRLVNRRAVRSAEAAPLLVPEEWRRALIWRFQDKDGNEVPIPVAESPMKRVQNPPAHEGMVSLLRFDLTDGWKIAGKDTATLNGEYRVLVSWGDIQQAQRNVLRFRPPENDAEKAYVLMEQARQFMRDGDARSAIELLEGVIEKHGEMLQEGEGAPAVHLLGDAFTANDDPGNALRCYRRYVEEYRRKMPPGSEIPETMSLLLSEAEEDLAEKQEREKQEEKEKEKPVAGGQ